MSISYSFERLQELTPRYIQDHYFDYGWEDHVTEQYAISLSSIDDNQENVFVFCKNEKERKEACKLIHALLTSTVVSTYDSV